MAIKLVKPSDQDAQDPMAALAAQADQKAAAPQARSLSDLLPPEVRAQRAKAAKAAKLADSGEDPRVTKFFAQQQALSSNPLISLDPLKKKAATEKLTNEFFKANPDLDPRLADETIKVKDKAVPAGKAVEDILRLVAAPDTNGLTKQAVLKTYQKIKGQLTPAQRAKYNLDELEKAGLLTPQDNGLLPTIGRGVGTVAGAPGLKQIFGGLGRTVGVTTALAHEAATGISKGVAALDGPGGLESSGEFYGWSGIKQAAEEHLTPGQMFQRNLNERSKAVYENTGKTDVSIIPGVHAGKYDPATGKMVYDTTGGGILDRNVGLAAMQVGGAAGEIVLDPTTYVSFGSTKLAKSGLKTLEAEHGMEGVAQLIRKKGWNALDDATKAEVTRVLTAAKDETAKTVQKLGAEGLTAKQIEDIARGGRKGLKVAGHTVVPFSPGAAGEEGAAITSRFANRVAPSEIQAGDHITNLLGTADAPSVVSAYDHSRGVMTIDPGPEQVSVLRKGETTLAGHGEFQVGDELMDGNAKIQRVFDDGSVEVKLDNQLESVERPFDIIPRNKVDMAGTQGTLMGTKEVPAPPPVYQQGTLLSKANEVPALAGVPKIAQESFDVAAADNLLRVADQVAPKAVDDVVQAGDQFIYRGPDGKAAGILSITDGKVETLYIDPALQGQGISNRLYQAADDAGIDVSKLGADEVTPMGERARASYLQSKGELPGRIDTATTYRVTKDGGTESARAWRIRTRDGKAEYTLKNGEHIVEPVKPPRQAIADAAAGASKADIHAANSGIEVGEVVGRTPEGNLLLKPAMGAITKTKVGEHVPGLFGILDEIRPDGTWVIRPDPSLFKKTAEVLTPEAYVAKAVAQGLDPAVAASVPKVTFQPTEAKAFHDAVEAAQAVEKKGRTVGETVYRYSVEEYADMKTFLSPDGKTGFAVKSDGDLVSVFNVGEKGAGEAAVVAGIGEGATKLDAFDESGFLPDKYAKFGFTETGRDAWNPEFAPEGWKGGTPDVVYMERAPVSPAAAPEPLSATTPTPGVSAPQGAPVPAASGAAGGAPPQVPGQTALFPPGSGAPLPNVPPYPPRPTVLEDVAREKAGKVPSVTSPDPEDQLKLFDMGIMATRDLKPGIRVRGLRGEVLENKGRRVIVARMDAAPQTVIRADQVLLLDASELAAEDILLDTGMKVLDVAADGKVTLQGASPLAIRRLMEETTYTKFRPGQNLADRLPGAQALRDTFIPRGSVEAAARAGEVPLAAAASLRKIQAGERAAIGNALNDMKLRMASTERRVRQALGREEGLRVLKTAFDVAAGEGAKAQALADTFREGAKTAVSSEAKQLNKAASAIETLIDIRREVAALEDQLAGRSVVKGAGQQGAFDLGALGGVANEAMRPGAADQMPLVLSEQGKKVLGLQPNIKDALGIERQLEHISQGFDFSERSGRGVLRIEDPTAKDAIAKWANERAAAEAAGKPFTKPQPPSFIEVPLSRSASEINDRIALALNDTTKAKLKITDDTPFRMFEENPLTAYSYRHRTAQTIAIEQDMLRQAEEAGLLYRSALPKADDGAALAAHDAWRKTVPEGYTEVRGWSTAGEAVYADPTVAKEMSKVRAVLRNDEELKRFKRIVDQASALWVRQVLSPITKGLGQQMRNLQSNFINGVFGGLTLDGQREAVRLQAGPLRQAGKLMKTEGLSFDAALAKLGLEAGSREATLLRYLREDDILNTGLYRSLDWGDTKSHKLLGGKAERAKELLSPLSGNSVLYSPGRVINTAIEDNGRMALYISVFDKTGSRDAAIDAVHKYMFDYADLTPFEQHTMKNVNAFYTFMRKNTALQLKVAMDRPALPLTVLKAKGALAAKEDTLLKPGESRERGLFQAGGAMQKLIGGQGVVGIDDPVTSAMRTIDPFTQGAYYTLNEVSKKLTGKDFYASLPPTERPTGQSVAKGFIGLTAGAPAEFMTTLAEIATGTDLRTDRDLTEKDTFDKLVSAIAPVWDQGQTLGGIATGDKPLRTNLVRMLAGITAYRRDDDAASYSLNYALYNELDQTIKLLQAQGVDVPTLSDLQDAGLVPTASELNKPRKVALSPEMKKAEARKKLGLAP